MRDKVAVIGSITVDRVVKRGKEIGYSPGGAINPTYILKELLSPEQVILVSNIGDDDYAKIYIEPELKKMKNGDYVKRVKNAKTNLYEIDVRNRERPRLIGVEEDQKLMNASFMDISELLPSVSTIYFHSCDPIFEDRYRNKMIELTKEAYEMNKTVIVDWNSEKALEMTKATGEQKKVLDMVHTFKMNRYEAGLFVEPETRKYLRKMRLRKWDLEKVADEIMNKHHINKLVMTLDRNGIFVKPRDGESLWFKALKPQIMENTLGTGSASSVPYILSAYYSNREEKLSERETGAFSIILSSVACENMLPYPHYITRTSIRQAIITKPGCKYCKDHGLDARGFAHKLGLL